MKSQDLGVKKVSLLTYFKTGQRVAPNKGVMLYH